MKKRMSLSKSLMMYIITSGLIFGAVVAMIMIAVVMRDYDDAYVQTYRERAERASEALDVELMEVESTVTTLATASENLYDEYIVQNGKSYNELEEKYYWFLSDQLESDYLPSRDVFIYLSPFLDQDEHDVWLSRDEVGRIHRHDEVPIERYLNHENMDWYYDVESLGRSSWTHSYNNRYGESNVAFMVPIFHDEIFIGIIGMYLDKEHVFDLIDQMSHGKTAFFWFVDSQDVVVYHPFENSGEKIEDIGYNIYGYGWDSSYASDVINNTTSRHFVSITEDQWKFIYTVSEGHFLQHKIDFMFKSALIFCLLLLPFYLIQRYYLKDYVKSYNQIIGELEENKSDGRHIELEAGFKTDAEFIIETINRDYQEIQDLRKSLDYMTNNNRISGLPNWPKMEQRLNQLLLDDEVEHICVMDIDMDYFKKINELLGHDIGNDVLRKVGKNLLNIPNQEVEIFHTDGDAFVALVKGIPRYNIHLIAELIQDAVKCIEIDGDYDLNLSCSMGIACYPEHSDEASELLKFAEIALYTSKASGKDQFNVFENSMHHELTELKMLEDDFINAIKERQFVNYYQLKYNSEGHAMGMEALVRWQHPQKGMIYPDNFIKYAEDTGLIIQLGDLVLRQACRDFKKLKASGLAIEHLAVNFSSVQLRETNFVDYILKVLHEEALLYEYLEIEVTETMLIDDREQSISKLKALRDLGIQISLDDFGSGYASINNIKDLPLSRLKIDRIFLSDIEENPRVIKMLDAVVKMAHGLELQVTAEGVESKRQLTLLQDCEVDEFQGYYLAKPKPLGEINHESMDRR